MHKVCCARRVSEAPVESTKCLVAFYAAVVTLEIPAHLEAQGPPSPFFVGRWAQTMSFQELKYERARVGANLS